MGNQAQEEVRKSADAVDKTPGAAKPQRQQQESSNLLSLNSRGRIKSGFANYPKCSVNRTSWMRTESSEVHSIAFQDQHLVNSNVYSNINVDQYL